MEPQSPGMDTDKVFHSVEPVMTSAEVSEYLGVSLNTLQKWRSRNIGPKYIKYGGNNSSAIRYDKKDVIRFRDAHTIRTRQGD